MSKYGTSKYVSGYCRRRTIKIQPNQESNHKESSVSALQLKNCNLSNVAINIAKTVCGTEESLLGGEEKSERKAQTIFETFFLHIFIGVVIGGTCAVIYNKSAFNKAIKVVSNNGTKLVLPITTP